MVSTTRRRPYHQMVRLLFGLLLGMLSLAGLSASSGLSAHALSPAATALPAPASLSRPSTVGANAGTAAYTVTPLSDVYSPKLNNYGQVVAASPADEGNYQIDLWTPSSPNSANGQTTRIGTMPMLPVAFNDFGQIALSGWADSAFHNSLWRPETAHATTGTLTDLNVPGAVLQMSNDGALVGMTGDLAALHEVFAWTPTMPNGPNGTARMLTNSGHYHQVTGINSSHVVCGMRSGYVGGGGNERAFALPIGTSNALTFLPPEVQGAGYYDVSYVYDISEAGEMVGIIADLHGTSDYYTDYILWRGGPTGFQRTSLPVAAQHINNRGDILGSVEYYNRTSGDNYQINTAPNQALTQAGITLYEFLDFNDAGQILANTDAGTVLLSPNNGRELKVFDANIDYSAGVALPVASSQSIGDAATAYFDEHATQRAAVAADGVTLLLLRLKLPPGVTGTARFRVEEDPVLNAELGSLWPVNSAALRDTAQDNSTLRDGAQEGPAQLDVQPVTINGQNWAFALYRSPRNFDADEETWGAEARSLIIRAGIAGESLDNTLTAPLSVVRPLVILQHGTFSNPATWSALPDGVEAADGFTLWLHGKQSDNNYQYTTAQPTRVPFCVARTSFVNIARAAGPMEDNARTVLLQVIDRLATWRELTHAAGTQVDVITHSYGGPTMRRAAQMEDVAGGAPNPLTLSRLSFRRAGNWGHGYFHKLITIAGSHRGSAMTNHAAWLNKNGAMPGLYARIANNLAKTPTHRGAMRDQFVLSDAMKSLRESRFPSHAFVGSGTILEGYTRYEAAPFLGAYLVDRAKGPYKKALPPVTGPILIPPVAPILIFANIQRNSNWHFNLSYTNATGPEGTPNYDLTVSSRSASAGLKKPFYSDITDLAGTNLEGRLSHLLQTNSRLVSERMIFLLHQKTTSKYFTHFPTWDKVPLDATEKKLANTTAYNPFWLVLGTPMDPTIASTAAAPVPMPMLTSTSGRDVCPGDHLTVTLSWPGKSIDTALLTWEQLGGGTKMALLGGAVLSQEITVPDLEPGRFQVGVVVSATDGSVETVELPLEICDPNTYTELKTEPSVLELRDTAARPLEVYGKLPNGEWRYLEGSTYTNYTVADPLVAKVTADQEIAPLKFGTTSVRVEHRGATIDVPINVDGTPVQVTAVLKGRNPSVDRNSTKAVEFAFLSSASFTAPTIRPGSILIGGRTPAADKKGVIGTVRDVNRDGKPDLVVTQIPAYLHLSPGPAQIKLLAATTSGTLVGGDANVVVR